MGAAMSITFNGHSDHACRSTGALKTTYVEKTTEFDTTVLGMILGRENN
jgi:hypothetical protein